MNLNNKCFIYLGTVNFNNQYITDEALTTGRKIPSCANSLSLKQRRLINILNSLLAVQIWK